jgi:uncharacterized coiled-coil protein SlyX
MALTAAGCLNAWAAPADGRTPASSASNARPGTEQREIEDLQSQLRDVQGRLDQLAEQNRQLMEKLQQVLSSSAAASAAAQVPVPVTGPVPVAGGTAMPLTAPVSAGGGAAAASGAMTVSGPAAAATAGTGLANTAGSGVRLWGYGELYYTDPTHDREKAQADLARAVFGIGYAFDSRTEFNSEFEVEHAVSSASDPGEFEVEQFYVDRQLNDAATLRAGLFLMPFGLLNEHHEPTNFYGVQRNFVETLIIPSTWREGGFNVHGDTASGFSWNVGVTTGFDLSKWNYAPEFPLYTTALDLEDNDIAPLQATHQELALANAHALSQYVALGYYGIPGVTLGAAIFTGDAVKVPAPPNAPIPGDQRVTLWEAHARWTPGKFDLSALYAHGAISNLALANAANPGSPNPIPSQFYGYYAQAASGLWESGDYRLAPFVRFERYDMGSKYAGVDGPVIPAGELPLSANPGDYGYWPQYQDRVWTVGANFYTTPHVVFKADYQWFHVNSDFSRFDLGLGLNF